MLIIIVCYNFWDISADIDTVYSQRTRIESNWTHYRKLPTPSCMAEKCVKLFQLHCIQMANASLQVDAHLELCVHKTVGCLSISCVNELTSVREPCNRKSGRWVNRSPIAPCARMCEWICVRWRFPYRWATSRAHKLLCHVSETLTFFQLNYTRP